MVDVAKEFRKSLIFKRLSLILLFSGPIIIIIACEISGKFSIDDDIIIKAAAGIFIGTVSASLLCMLGFRCPNCGKVFDIRTGSCDLYHCPRCGALLQ